MYIGQSQAGSRLEGRKDKHTGNTMKPGALTKYAKIFGLRMNQKSEDWSIFPLTEYQYMTEIKSFVPHSLFCNEEGELQVKRLETLSFWHASYQEVIRHLGLAAKLTRSELYPEIKAIVDSYADDIKDAFVKYIHLICTEGDFSFEQFKYYVKEHEGSSAPWAGMKWGDLLRRPSQLKVAYAECLKAVKQFEKDLPKIMQFEKPLIKADFVYAALRARPADYEIIDFNNDKILARCSKTRDRKAGGVLTLSQLEWPIYHKIMIKRKIYQQAFYDLVSKISGCELNAIIMTGANFYKDIIDVKPYAYDLRNAEKLVGILLPMLPIMVDLGDPHYPADIAGELYSGVGPTRPGSELVVALVIRFLKERGITPTKLFLGGDNFGLDVDISTSDEGFDILFTKEDSILGWLVNEQKFGPYSCITDNVKNRWNVPSKWSSLTSVQNYQFVMRPLQVVVNNDIMQSDSAVNLIKWVCERTDFDQMDIYGKTQIYETIAESEILREAFYDRFSDELNFVKEYVPTHTDEKRTTDAHLITYR
jgi:hypothetical protein